MTPQQKPRSLKAYCLSGCALSALHTASPSLQDIPARTYLANLANGLGHAVVTKGATR